MKGMCPVADGKPDQGGSELPKDRWKVSRGALHGFNNNLKHLPLAYVSESQVSGAIMGPDEHKVKTQNDTELWVSSDGVMFCTYRGQMWLIA